MVHYFPLVYDGRMNHKRKVLIGITKSNFGGAQRYVLDLATMLPKGAFEVAVICGGEGPLVTMLHDAGIRVIALPALQRDVRVWGDIRVFFSLIALLRRERPDILHLNSSKMGGIGALAGKIMRIRRVVFTAHGWEFNAPRPRWQKRLIRIFSTYIVALADQTIAISSAIKKDIGVLQNKITVIHHGIEEVAFLDRDIARHAIADRIQKPIDTNGLWFGTIAELHKVKGLDCAIRAFAEVAHTVPHSQYILIGEGREHADLAALIDQRGLRERVHLVGFIPDAARLLKACDVFVLPSRSEGLGYVVLEAGLASLPVIASKVGGISEIITSEVNGLLVTPEDVSGLSNAMTTLARDEGLREKLGRALHQRVRDQFSFSHMITNTIAVYE